MAGTKFSDYLGLNHYRKAKKLKHFTHLGLAQGPQSFVTHRSISPAGNSGYQLKKSCSSYVMELKSAFLR